MTMRPAWYDQACEHAGTRIARKLLTRESKLHSALSVFVDKELANEEAKILIAGMNHLWAWVPGRGWRAK